MRKSQLKRFIIATLIVAIFCTSIIAILIATKKTYSAFSNVYVPGGNNVAVYVSGNDVKKAGDGKYTAPQGKTITVTVVNEKKLFKEHDDKRNDVQYARSNDHGARRRRFGYHGRYNRTVRRR